MSTHIYKGVLTGLGQPAANATLPFVSVPWGAPSPRGRTDLLIEWPLPGQAPASLASKHVIECKVVGVRSGLQRVIRDGLQQTAWYMDRCGARSGHLVVFDMRPGRSWEQRVFRRDPDPDGNPITVWGM